MIRFECDYNEGAHEAVLDALIKTNALQSIGYGEDEYCAEARALIRSECGDENAAVHFLVGGTQTNALMISAALRPYQGVLSADSGHIAVHETGAVEAYGHKVLTIPAKDGKIDAASVRSVTEAHFNDHAREHTVQPGMVYVSQPTETGTLYSRKELAELYAVCKELGLYLYVDGARLGYALGSDKNDIQLSDMRKLCDAFYIGGTKCGLLFGEALVLFNDSLKKDFRYSIKQHGAMLAKGRLLGVQFAAIMKDGLYRRICRGAVEKAMRIKKALTDAGISFLNDSYTNQLFPVFENTLLERLSEKYSFDRGERFENLCTAVRICVSFATSDSAVDTLINDIISTKKALEVNF